MDENEIASKSHEQAFVEEFSEPGGSVAEGVVGKIYCPCREDSLLNAGSGKLISRVNIEFSSGNYSVPPKSSAPGDAPAAWSRFS